MKGKHLFPMLLFAACPAVYAQQPAIEGQVSIHNSQYLSGNIEYVEGVLVSAPFTTTETTNKKGKFKLEFAGVDGGNSVNVQVEKAGLEVANPDALYGLAIGRESPLRIFLAKEGYLERVREELIKSSKNAIAARHEALIANLRRGGVDSQAAIFELENHLNREISSTFDGEQILNEQKEELKKWLPERVDALARVNLDFASEAFRQSFKLFEQGKLEAAVAALQQGAPEKEAEDVVARLQGLRGAGKLRQAAEEAEKARQFVEAYWLRGQAELLLFQYRNALESHQKSASILEKAGGEGNTMALAEAYAAVALNYLLLGENEYALHYQQKNVKIVEQLLNGKGFETAASYHLLAAIYRNLEQYPSALEAQQRAVSIKEEALPPGHPELVNEYSGLARIYHGMGEYKLALEAQQKAIGIQEQSLPPNHPDIADSYSTLAEIFMDEGTHLKALEAQLKALFIQERALPPGHPAILRSHSSLALIYLNLGEYDKALAIQKKVIAIQEKTLPPGHPDTGASLHNLVSTFYLLNSLDSALLYEQKAYAILKEELPAAHPHLQAVKSTFAFLYSIRGERRQEAGQYEPAIQDLRMALEFQPDYEDAKKRIREMEAMQVSVKTNSQEALALRGPRTKAEPPAEGRRPVTQESRPAPARNYYGTFRITKETSLRERPTSSSRVLSRLAVGEKLQVVEKTEHYWWKVLDNGRTGYVKALLLEPAD